MRFNGISKDYLRVNMSLFRPPTAPLEIITDTKLKGGERVKGKRLSALHLDVPIVIRSEKRIELLKHELSNWLVHAEPKKLVFLDTPNRYYLAYYNGMVLEEKYKYAKGVISFYMPEGYRFGDTQSREIQTSFGNLMNAGQLATSWSTLTIFKNNASSFVFENDKGEKITLNHAFEVNDRLEIDYAKRLIKLNGQPRMALLSLDSRWFMLQPGANRLRASHVTTVSYTETYY